MNVRRRRVLLGVSLVGLSSLAGCLDDDVAGSPDGTEGRDDDSTRDGADDVDDGSDDADGSDDGTDDATGSSDADETDAADPDDAEATDDSEREPDDEHALLEHETVSYSVPTGEPRAEALSTESELEAAIVDAPKTEELEAFVEETDFDHSVVFLLRARGPNLCYELDLESVEVDDDGVTVEARVVDTSTPEQACAQQIHYPTLLVRAVFKSEIPKRGSITITGADGTAHGFAYATAVDEESG